MRILVYPHELGIGGSQLNAVELAAAVRDRGHEVALFGTPGPLSGRIAELRLPFYPAPLSSRRPSLAAMGALRRLVRAERFDLVHGYEWPPALDAFYGPGLVSGVPVLCTVMSMAVAPFLPRSLPLVVGTRQIAAQACGARPGRRTGAVDVIEPPVDTEANSPDVDGGAFRHAHGIASRELLVVVVSRLVADLKLEGLERSIAAAGQLAYDLPLRLMIVGDGPARPRLAELARGVNFAAGRELVILTGTMLDPRPAYAAADVVMGMGGAILRGLAFAKPAVVLGEDGFSEILTPDTADRFLWRGWYGLGSGDRDATPLATQLRSLLTDELQRHRLARFSRQLVCERFSLTRAAARQEAIYLHTIDHRPPRLLTLTHATSTTLKLANYKLHRRLARLRHRAPTEDFNARPAPPPPPKEEPDAACESG